MKVYDFLEKGDRRTKEYRFLGKKFEELKEKYGEIIGGKLRLDVGEKHLEVFEFCEMEVNEAVEKLKKT